MKRAGFTMIELIFVIVILGILSAVALPKMMGVSTNAKIATVESFMATMNRTVGPSMWAQSVMDGNGSVKDLNITDYVDLPNGITVTLANCDLNGTNSGGNAGAVSTAALPTAEVIFCKNGSSVGSPMFSFTSMNNDVDANISVQEN